MNLVEKARELVRSRGFKSKIQITLDLMKDKHSAKDIELAIKSLECNDIQKVEYTNTYVAPWKTKELYYYNPHQKKKRKRKTSGRRKKKS